MKVRRKSDREHYYAALERTTQARILYDEGHYGYSIYTSGLAVECIFSAFILQLYPDHIFIEGHDLKELLKKSKLLEDLPTNEHITLSADFLVVFNNWHNSFRFASESRIKGFIVKRYRKQKPKGDIFKYGALQIVESAANIVERGAVEWEKC